MYKSLEDLLKLTVDSIDQNFKNMQIAFDCNSDYGQVLVGINPIPKNVPMEIFFGEKAGSFFSFGDWEYPDIRHVNSELDKVWVDKWSKYEAIIRDDWMDLNPFEEKFNRENFLENVCKIAASFKREIPVLVADHDEHINYSVNRLKWAYSNNKDSSKSVVSSKIWLSRDDSDYLNYLSFFTSGKFINHARFLDGSDEVEMEGEWDLSGNILSMTVEDTNLEEFEYLYQLEQYKILELNSEKLNYKNNVQEWLFSKFNFEK